METTTIIDISEDLEQVAQKCVEICDMGKADNIQLYDVRGTSILSDHYLICTANSEPHIRALCMHLEDDMEDAGVELRSMQGTPKSQWVIMDFGSILVHIFVPQSRDYYRLDELWKEGKLIFDSNKLDAAE